VRVALEAGSPAGSHRLVAGSLHAQRGLRHADGSSDEVANGWALVAVSALPSGCVAHGVILVTVISSGTPRAIAASRVSALHPPGVVQVHDVESVTVDSEYTVAGSASV